MKSLKRFQLLNKDSDLILKSASEDVWVKKYSLWSKFLSAMASFPKIAWHLQTTPAQFDHQKVNPSMALQKGPGLHLACSQKTFWNEALNRSIKYI